MSNYMNLALSRWDRVFLFADGVLRFRPNPTEDRPHRKGSKAGRPSKYGNPNGHVRKCAKQYLDGFYGELSCDEVAYKERIGNESFRTTVCKIKVERRTKA